MTSLGYNCNSWKGIEEMARKERIELIKKIQEKRKSKLLCYLTSDRQNLNVPFAKDVLPIFSDHLNDDTYDKIDVLMFTLGGDTLAAFGLNKLLREYTESLAVLVPHICHSAGTLFALGCNQILMTKNSSLGPIDPSVNGPLNPAVNVNGQTQILPLSVESVAGFRGLVKDEWKIQEPSDLSAILKLLAEKVHPLALGNVYRSRQQIELLATTLLKSHRDDNDKIHEIVQKLTKELGSHDYLIFGREARELLGTQIVDDDSIERLIKKLHKDFAEEMELGKPFDSSLVVSSIPPQTDAQGQRILKSIQVGLKFAVIESEEKGDSFIQERLLTEAQIRPHPNAPPVMGVQEEIKFNGWKQYD